MKEFSKKHMAIFCVIMIAIAVSSNLILGILQENYATGLVSFFLIEAGFKAVIIFLLLILMVKWQLFNKGIEKKILWGCLIGALNLLFILENVLPLTLVNPAFIKVDVIVIVSICLAKISVGVMEELGIRGVLLPLLCEKWTEKTHFYMKAAVDSSLLFAGVHFSWTIRKLLFIGGISWADFLVNLSQVFFTFCFGMLAAGITLFSRSIIPMLVWHSLVSISAFLGRGLISDGWYQYYIENFHLIIQNVFEKHGILSKVENGYAIFSGINNIVVLVVGIILIHKVEKGARGSTIMY